MTAPYLVVSDIHAHSWAAYSTTNSFGVNSRLQIILDELDRAADELEAAGGSTIVMAGDLFHQRGSIDPEVFNPVHRMIENLINRGFIVLALPGNHDLKGKETTELGNAFQSMSGWSEFKIAIEPLLMQHVFDAKTNGNLLLVPWQSSNKSLMEILWEHANAMETDARENTDVFIHAGIDGVIPGLPDHGLTAESLKELGFKRVFAGHYHNHKVMEGGKVISIGATTQHTFSDLGAKAGFLLVYPDRVEYRASNAPDFVEITGDTEPEDIPAIVDGNYVRIRSMKLTDAEIKDMREELVSLGAKGVTFQVAREVVSARTGAVATKSVSLEASIDNYIDTLTFDDLAAVKFGCADILTTVRSVAE